MEEPNPFRISSFYSAASLVAVAVAAALIILFVRRLAIEQYIQFAEQNNLVLAQTMLNKVRPELLRFLAIVQDIKPGQSIDPKLARTLSSAAGELMQQNLVVRVKIYNRQGTVVFSTKYEQIGSGPESDGGFESAIRGRIASWLIYRDTLNGFHKGTEDDNLMSTYVPIQGPFGEPIPGVLEIYTDANPLVQRNERTEFEILVGIGLVFGILYLSLLLVVRRAGKVTEMQQHIIREKSATLEMLFAHVLSSEEQEKQRIAADLHEGLAQTLCAIKTQLDATSEQSPARSRTTTRIEPIIPVLQGAIEQVRAIATGLRPSSLDDLGLLLTLDWFCENFEQLNPRIRIQQNISLEESDTPGPLKIVIYRIIEKAFRSIARVGNTDRIRLVLRKANGLLVLEIEDTPRDSAYAAPSADRDAHRLGFSEIEERATLSGGSFSVRRTSAGGVALRASWPTGHTSVTSQTTDTLDPALRPTRIH